MNIYPIFFLGVFGLGSMAALARGPIWALMTYIFIYFNIPAQQWWGSSVPDLRWSLISAAVVVVSCFLHQDQLVPAMTYRNYPSRLLTTFLILMILLTPFSQDPDISWPKVYDFFRYVLIFYLVTRIISDFEKLKLFLFTIIGCSFYLSILARHYFTGTRLDGVGLPDASDANMLAALMLLLIPFLCVFLFTGKKYERIAAFFATPFIINAFMMCRSRGAFLGFAVQLLLLTYLLFTQSKKGRLKILLGSLALVAFFFSLMDPQFKARLFQHGDTEEEEFLAEVSAGRVVIWRSGLNMFWDHPFGVGGDGFMLLSPEYVPEQYIEKGVGQRASHNTFILVLVEQGIFGFIVFLFFLRSLFLMVQNVKLKLRDDLSQGANPETCQNLLYHNLAIEASLAGFWTAAIFIDRLYFEGIYLMEALVPCLYYLAGTVDIPGKSQALRMVTANIGRDMDRDRGDFTAHG